MEQKTYLRTKSKLELITVVFTLIFTIIMVVATNLKQINSGFSLMLIATIGFFSGIVIRQARTFSDALLAMGDRIDEDIAKSQQELETLKKWRTIFTEVPHIIIVVNNTPYAVYKAKEDKIWFTCVYYADHRVPEQPLYIHADNILEAALMAETVITNLKYAGSDLSKL